MRSKTLPELFSRTCSKHSYKVAYLYRPRFRTLKWTYSDIWNHANSFANILLQQGVQKGDKVILIGYNSPFWVAAFFGIQLQGAVAVPLSPESKSDFIQNIVSQTEAKIILKNKTVLTKGMAIPSFIIEDIPKPKNTSEISTPTLKENDIAEIVYTSGTTGAPKGVVLTHKNIISNLLALRKAIPIDHTNRFVSILPLFHMLEQLGGFLIPFSVGAQVSYAASINPNHLQWIFEDDKPTHMVIVPEFLRLIYLRLRNRAEEEGKLNLLKGLLKISYFLPMVLRRRLLGIIHRRFGWKIHTMAVGGAPLEEEVERFWEGLGIYVLQGYGLTETSPILAVNSYRDRKTGSVGKPIQGVDIKLAKDGEILAKGPNVFSGYWRQEGKTIEVFDNEGWFKTGDIGFFDKDGYLYIKGRKKFVIVLPSGENVYPEDIEFEINKQPEIVDSTVIGLKKHGSEEVHAVLLLDKSKKVNPKAIIDRVNKSLLSYQLIKGFSIWPHDDFPRTPTRKVKKHQVLPVIKNQIQGKEQDEFVIPTTSKLKSIIAKVAEIPLQEIGDEKRLVADFGLDSLKRIELVARIEREFSVSVDEAEINTETTVKDMEVVVAEKKHKQVRYPFKSKPFYGFTVLLRDILQKTFLKPIVLLLAPIEIKGLDNIKDVKHPALFFSNHLSSIDAPFIYGVLPNRIRKKLSVATATDVLYEANVPWIKYTKEFFQFLFLTFPFAREGQTKSSFEYLGRIIDRNFSVLVFPEGYMSRTGNLREFKLGSGLLAIEMAVPIIPIRLSGTQYVIPPGIEGAKPEFSLPKRHKVSVAFGKPFLIDPKMNYKEATSLIKEKIRNLE
ncbi:MAG: AMP-binding protein [Patescibacteria group bacterium]|nr:AMP-binding protein [Patescibacteria group bacterium]